MKNLAILVAIIFFSCCVTSQVTARDLESSLGDEKHEWWHYHYFCHSNPKPNWPFPSGKALPPIPAGHFHPVPFHPPPEVTKCLSDCKDVRTCFADIAKAFFTHKPAIGTDCCTQMKKMSEDCEKIVLGSFHNTFFNSLVKMHCSHKSGSTQSAPSPA